MSFSPAYPTFSILPSLTSFPVPDLFHSIFFFFFFCFSLFFGGRYFFHSFLVPFSFSFYFQCVSFTLVPAFLSSHLWRTFLISHYFQFFPPRIPPLLLIVLSSLFITSLIPSFFLVHYSTLFSLLLHVTFLSKSILFPPLPLFLSSGNEIFQSRISLRLTQL